MSWNEWNARKQEKSSDWYIKQQITQLLESRNHFMKRFHLLEVRSQQQELNINEITRFVRELQSNLEPRVAEVEKQIQKIEDRCRFWIDNLDARVSALEDNIQFYREQIEACQQRIDDLLKLDGENQHLTSEF